jgi:tetratricopeptide (TPR) repeat protein
MKILMFLIIAIFAQSLYGQEDVQKALEYWKNGDIEKTQNSVNKILKTSPDNDTATLLQAKILFVQGKYNEAVKCADKNTLLNKYPDAVNMLIEAYLHLNDYNNAVKIAESYKSERTEYLKELADKQLKVIADKTYLIPFVEDASHTSDIIPLTTMYINGVRKSVMFDTGAEYLILGEKIAAELGIKYGHKRTGEHATTKTSVWQAIVDSISFEKGPVLLNVPAVIMGGAPDMMIWGTNILEQFLSTIDYPNRRFILTPRKPGTQYEEHFRYLSAKQKTIPFYLWGNHYMFAKGVFAKYDSLNLFFDSGLCAMGNINGEVKQASFTASKESLLKWGFEPDRLKESTFLPVTDSLGIKGLTQPNTLIWYDKNLEKDRSFGGVRIDGLISHSWLKKYSWTIDFDKMEYSFGIKQ